MKDDAPAPRRIPKKRRVLEDTNATLDRWLAEWLDRPDLTPSERRRVQEERERRKQARRAPEDVTVGVLVGREGMTPEQTDYIAGYCLTLPASAVVCVGSLPRKLAVRLDGIAIVGAPDDQAVVRSADVVIAAPKKPHEPTTQVGVWAGVKYAKHRSLPVRVVLPNGEEA